MYNENEPLQLSFFPWEENMNKRRFSSLLALFIAVMIGIPLTPAGARGTFTPYDLLTPANSGKFGQSVTVLPNGNFVVTDPYWPFYTDYTEARGAVYMYSPSGDMISRLIGDHIGNSVGGNGITVLKNGDFVVNSPFWDTPTIDGVGAVTWCSQQTGCNGSVSASNSLIGSHNGDMVGFGGVTALSNGNYVVGSPHWWRGNVMWAGAVTWGNGNGGTVATVSEANSWVGSSWQDQVSNVMPLSNGNYLVLDAGWDNGSIADAGAVTWGNGLGGSHGVISAANSLVGSNTDDAIGDTFWGRVVELSNGNYVVVSSVWDLDATHPDRGAVTWGSGTAGVAGQVSEVNSLIGNCATPLTHSPTVTPLTNGNYVVTNTLWSPDGGGNAWGAVTWGSGTIGVKGNISSSNSLVGSRDQESVGYGNFFSDGGVIALTNGNYVVNSYSWNNDGAVTWGNGTTGVAGHITESNSLIGSAGQVIALTNGNYVVSSSTWSYEDPGLASVGAVIWGNGATGTTGRISASSSLVGEHAHDNVGDGGLVALTNGNYVVINHSLGSVTWVNGSHASIGLITASNSLSGNRPDDQIGYGFFEGLVKPLTNGNYVVISPYYDNGGLTDAGAITWGNGASGTSGVVSASNSLVGTSANDSLGSDDEDGGVTILTNGNYVVSAPQWDNGSAVDAGAVTWGNGEGGTHGVLSSANSLVGSSTDDNVGSGSFWGDVGVTALPDGDYMVNSPWWKNAVGQGAITWGDGSSGTAGEVSATNSLVNTCAGNLTFCQSTMVPLPDDNVTLHLPSWSDGTNYGAISLITGLPNGTVGELSLENSVLGQTASYGGTMVASYDPVRVQWVIGRPSDNKVTLFGEHVPTRVDVFLPLVIK
jgi:hypothetical protein